MEIQISAHLKVPGLDQKNLRRKLERVLKDLGCHDRELSVLLTDDARMADLNARYLGRRGPTNVLAFPMTDSGDGGLFEGVMLGDVVISIDTALREAGEAGETLESAIERLLVHGLLHLMGYDHEGSEACALRMEKEERRLLRLMQGGNETNGAFGG